MLEHAHPVTADEMATEAPPRLRKWHEGWGPAFWISITFIGGLAFLAVTADFMPFIKDPDKLLSVTSDAPSLSHPLGTDSLGRDMLSRIVYGARVSLLVGFVSVALGTFLGGGLGLVAGYLKGKWDIVIMGAMDVLLSFPALVLAIAVVVFLGPSTPNVVIALSSIAVPYMARIARANTLSVSQKDYVAAAVVIGASKWRIITREILPAVSRSLVSFGLTYVAVVIVAESILAFLGMSIPPPTPTWGGMIAEGKNLIETKPMYSLIPAAVLLALVFSLNTVGDKVQDRFDVKGSAL